MIFFSVRFRAIALSALAFAAAPLPSAEACSPRAMTRPAIETQWRSMTTHPLVGVAGNLANSALPLREPCDYNSSLSMLIWNLSALLSEGHVVSLGEIHDNGQHHNFRADFLRSFDAPFAGGKRINPAVAFEQIRADQQPALDTFAAIPDYGLNARNTADLLRLLDWDKSPWSKTADYTPLFSAAVNANLPIFAADPPRDLMRKTAKEGPSALPPEERTRLGLDTPLPDAQAAASLAEIEGSHCGMIPKSAHANMAYAQRYRDAHMADVLLKASAAHGSAILIAGNGHVRSDRGVAWYLRQRAPEKKVISVLFVEVEDGKNDPAAYIERDPTGAPIADYIVFTPKHVRDKDPCETMREQMAKPK
jgi:uncharacterized iron-regulated protein